MTKTKDKAQWREHLYVKVQKGKITSFHFTLYLNLPFSYFLCISCIKGRESMSMHYPCFILKRPNPLGLKCDTITSPRRLVNTFIHQMIPDLLKRDKPIKVANNFKSWSTTRDISSEWGWSSPIYAAKQISGPTATGKVGNSRNSYPISFFWKTTNKQGWVQTYSAAHLHPRNGEIRYNAWNM